MKLFDRFSKQVFKSMNTVFGSVAVWIPVDGSPQFSGPVLFNNPTHKEVSDGAEFIDADPCAEWLAPAFDGLKEAVDQGGLPETLTIDGVGYYVTEVQRLEDGNNYKAYLRLVNDNYGPQN